MAPSSENLGGYTLQGELGRGASSMVFRATRDGEEYALKRLTDPSPEAAQRFRREAAALARVRHPSLVDVVELGASEGAPFLVMSLAEGRTLRAVLEEGPLGATEAVRAGRDVAGALAEVHRHRLLHRDIKPENIMLEDDGSAVLIDFGLATAAADGEFAGTPHYSSPEQLGVLSVPPSPASDLYGLGATLFEALTGSPPLTATDGDFIHRLATVAAPDVRTLAPSVRPALALILGRLLEKDPDQRYASARGLVADLDRLAALDEALARGDKPNLTLGDTRAPLTNSLVGRARELEFLVGQWGDARDGVGAAVQLQGTGGAGKSRLARELAAHAADAGARVLSTKCQLADQTPLGPLRELADQLLSRLARLPADERGAEVARLRAAAGETPGLVGRLAPALADLLGAGTARMGLEPAAEQQRFYAALASFVAGLATPERPLLWVLDDIQWMDAGTTEVLSILAAQEPRCVLLLSTARPEPADAVARYVAALSPLLVDDHILELEPLGEDAVAALGADRLGGRPLAPAIVAKLRAATRGNPFALEEYLRALLERGVLRPTPDGWTADGDALDALSLPSDVVQLLVERLDELPPDASELLPYCAVLGGRFDAARLATVSRSPPARVSSGLAALVDAGLLERDAQSQFRFHHDRVREAVQARLTPDASRDIHEAVADALSALPSPDAAEVYAIATHRRLGHPTRAPQPAAEANLAGGLLALEQHAYESAWEMLDFARESFGASAPGTLHAPLGRACAMTGRLESAFAHLEAALPHANTRWAQFELQYLITLTHASQGQNDRGLVALYRAFDLLDTPYPRGQARQALSLVWVWVTALVLGALGIGAGDARGDDIQRRLAVSRLHYVGSMLALFDGDVFLTLQFIVRDLGNVHSLPPTAEKAIATTNYGSLLGSFGLRRPMRRFTDRGVAIAEDIGDPAAIAVCRAYRALGHKWAGDLDRGTELLLDTLPMLTQAVPGSWYASMMITEQSYSYMHAGRARAAYEHTLRYMPSQDRTGNLLFTYNTRAVHYAACEALGDARAAAEAWGRLEPHFARYGSEMRLTRGQARFERMIDRRDLSDFDGAYPELEQQFGEDYYSLYAWELLGYAEMLRLEGAAPGDIAQRQAALAAVIRKTFPRFTTPVFRCHLHVWRAALARSKGRPRRADRALSKAERLAGPLHSPLAEFRIAEQRAALAHDPSDALAGWHAQRALTVAEAEGWVHKAQQIRDRFGVASPAASTPAPTNAVGRDARFADALLEVSLASSASLDVDAMAQKALAATARVLGAERALFFLADDDGALTLAAAVGDDTDAISQSAVRTALETRQAVVITGDERGEELASASIVAHGLRSILAAPLMLRGAPVGVVYLDNRLAKGLFVEDDVQLMLGLANQMAVALETARAARLEVERASLAQDVELVGAVQEMFLPKETTIDAGAVQGVALYRPASRSGGDWWWSEELPSGALCVWIGDVNGHGAGPAMVTATVSGAFHALRASDPPSSCAVMMAALNQQVRGLGGRLLMSMTAVEIDAGGETLTVWSAGGPPVFVVEDGALEPVGAASPLLGTPADDFAAVPTRRPLAPGARVFACTDGLLELDTAGGTRQLGARGVDRFLRATANASLAATRDALTTLIDARLDGRDLPDDITAVLLQVRAGG